MRTKPLPLPLDLPAQNKPHHYLPPLILPATRTDIPTLIDIYLAAEGPDLLYSLQLRSKSEKEIKDELIEQLEENFGHESLIIMKALDRESGEVAGLAIWQLRGYGVKSESENGGGSEDVMMLGGGGWMFSSTETGAKMKEKRKVTPIEKYLDTAFKSFLSSWLAPTKCIYLALLMTHPSYQRRGIGTAMLGVGHEKADREGVPCFLIASPVGRPLYETQGWKGVEGTLELDLREWVEGDGGKRRVDDRGWGVYRFYYMMRLPRNAP
ncbi:hypothetical protein B0J14DRAFT_662903 [Halenospora varia]|nr:hypothetical protein B0J14DRAFT_662903 [Halenospora varia]